MTVVLLLFIPTTNYENDLFNITEDSKHLYNLKNIIEKFELHLCHSKGDCEILSIPTASWKNPASYHSTTFKPERTSFPNEKLMDKSYISMEIVLEEFLQKFRINHVTWCKDKEDKFWKVIAF
ncbi:hypothetical protein TKK_0015597 [Trichogramma kaykai]